MIIFVGKSLVDFQLTKNALKTAFQIKCLGILKYFLDQGAVYTKKGIS